MKYSKPPVKTETLLVPPVDPPPKGLKEMPLKSNLDIINEHYALLKDKDKYGKDSNGIYFKDEFVLTIDNIRELSKKSLNKILKLPEFKNAFNTKVKIEKLNRIPCPVSSIHL